jgi:hypothetical protein
MSTVTTGTIHAVVTHVATMVVAGTVLVITPVAAVSIAVGVVANISVTVGAGGIATLAICGCASC